MDSNVGGLIRAARSLPWHYFGLNDVREMETLQQSPSHMDVVESITVQNKFSTALIMHIHMLRPEAKNAQNYQANGCKFVTNVEQYMALLTPMPTVRR